ncbi:MAG TPA: MFS transporter [Candidatus Lokiarchaeia archaeon]|nr:MFS transporter [Candidatus Lokiarchaeia archaeon]
MADEKSDVPPDESQVSLPSYSTELSSHKVVWQWRWLAALLILALGTQVYGDVEAQYFSSYLVHVGGGTYLEVGIMVALRAVVGAIFYLIWGVVGDNIRPRIGHRVMIILIGCVVTAGLMFLFVTSSVVAWLIICSGVLLAISSNMFNSNNRAIIADLTPEDRRGRTNTLISVLGLVGSMVVWLPTVTLLPGGAAEFSWETHFIFIGGAAVIIAVTGLATLGLVKEPPPVAPPRSWTQDLRDIFDRKEMAKHTDFLKLFLAKIFMIASTGAYYSYLLLLLQNLNYDLTTVLLAIPLIGVPAGLGFYLGGKLTDTIGRRKVTIVSLTIAPLGGLVITFLGATLIWLMVGFAIMLPFTVALGIATDSWTLDLFPKESRGRFAGVMNIGGGIGTAAGVLIAGAVATFFTNPFAIFAVAGAFLWVSIPFFLHVPEVFKPRERTREMLMH